MDNILQLPIVAGDFSDPLKLGQAAKWGNAHITCSLPLAIVRAQLEALPLATTTDKMQLFLKRMQGRSLAMVSRGQYSPDHACRCSTTSGISTMEQRGAAWHRFNTFAIMSSATYTQHPDSHNKLFIIRLAMCFHSVCFQFLQN